MKTFNEFLELKKGDCIDINLTPLFIITTRREGLGAISTNLKLQVIDEDGNIYLIRMDTYKKDLWIYDLSKPIAYTYQYSVGDKNGPCFERRCLNFKDVIKIKDNDKRLNQLKTQAVLEVLKELNEEDQYGKI